MISKLTRSSKRLIRRFLERGGYNLNHKSAAPWGTRLSWDVERLLNGRKVQTVIDGGANVGQTAERFTRMFPEAVIWSLEPIQATFDKLVCNTSHCENIRAHQLALSDSDGISDIAVYDNSHIASLVRNVAEHRFGVKEDVCRVDTVKLDTFCDRESIGHIDLLKLDVEGAEVSALTGAERLIADRKVSLIYAEFNSVMDKSDEESGGHTSLQSLCEFLEPRGFRFVSAQTDFVRPDLDYYVNANVLFVGVWV